MRSLSPLFVAFVLAAATPGAARAADPLPPSTFDYARIAAAPPVLRQRRMQGVLVRDIEIPKAAGGVAKAYVVTPDGNGPFGGVLMVHWLGEEDSNREEFLDDALALARRGIVSVLPDAMWSARDWYSRGRTHATDYANSIEQVKELRRALDVLLLQKGVDSNAIAYVGHDFGAMYGAVLSGVDRRARYYAFMAGTTSFNDWYLYGKPPPNVDAYRAQMGPLDPVLYLREASIADALFQFARHDFYVPPKKFADFYVADKGPKTLRIYDEAGHDLMIPAAIEERRDWLVRHVARKSVSREYAWSR
ncbi:MAG: hypothetical protein JO359_07730 [Candidatus Eremiobacteraeota bacterium]|nr:hypothetical protein [Candidatus Eremiobacteraeota bacterium]